MAKVKAVKFHSDFCELGVIKYEAGKSYVKDEETDRCVLLNFGEVVTIDDKQLATPQLALNEQFNADQAAAELAAAQKLAADQDAADKLAAIQTLNSDLAQLEAELAALPETEEPGFAAGFLAKIGIGAKGTARESVQAAIDAKRVELAALQPAV